jgi:hypothetical protein
MKRTRPSKERLDAAKAAAQAKRAELGLEPVAPGNAEYEAAQKAQEARRKRK